VEVVEAQRPLAGMAEQIFTGIITEVTMLIAAEAEHLAKYM
jgi:hypothetical protein